MLHTAARRAILGYTSSLGRIRQAPLQSHKSGLVLSLFTTRPAYSRPAYTMPIKETQDVHPLRKDMDEPNRIPNRLVLCFDGTGNTFQGNTGDTNIVKLLNMFDRSAPHQMHYYQRK